MTLIHLTETEAAAARTVFADAGRDALAAAMDAARDDGTDTAVAEQVRRAVICEAIAAKIDQAVADARLITRLAAQAPQEDTMPDTITEGTPVTLTPDDLTDDPTTAAAAERDRRATETPAEGIARTLATLDGSDQP